MTKSISLFLVAIILVTACSASPTRTPRPTLAETPTSPLPAPTSTPLPSPSPTATEEPEPPTDTPTPALPTATLVQNTVCRMGPGGSYNPVVTAPKGTAVNIQGRNEDATWVLAISGNENLSCWIPVSVIESPEGLEGLAVSKYEALPAGPTWITVSAGGCADISRPVFLQWGPVSSETQYRIFRNGRAISTITGSGQFYDANITTPNKAVVYTYAVQAFNDYGGSTAVSATVSICAKK